MLKDTLPVTMIPVKDLEGTRRFNEDVLGFAPDIDEPTGISYRSEKGRFNVYPTEYAGTAQHTLIGWQTDDIEKALDELIAKGVTFEQYDMGDFKTNARGIVNMGEERAAWFKDPEGNILSIWQVPRLWQKK
jgi:catechol 2,3-dioxygenase-like lactoylglutathione lyase family enzyme